MSTTHATGTHKRTVSGRLVWLIPAGLSLILGLNAGLLLLGLPAPLSTKRLPNVHGMLLTLGTVATLVALERSSALGRWYGYIAPILLGFSGLSLTVDAIPLIVAKIGLVLGCAAFTLLYVPLWRRQFDATVLTQLLGASLALAASVLWLADPPFSRIILWLIAFLVLTIAAERVELARITMGEHAGTILLLHAWALTITLVVSVKFEQLGAILFGIILLSLVAWLIRHDIARRTIRATGAVRYMAANILAGYFWLAVAAAVLLMGAPDSGARYDTVIHAVFLGYTFSMILAHAITILPAVLRIDLPYRPVFWVPAVLLQIALIVRLWIGHGLDQVSAWKLGGALGVAALIIFILVALTSAIMGAPKQSLQKRGPQKQEPREQESQEQNRDKRIEPTVNVTRRDTTP